MEELIYIQNIISFSLLFVGTLFLLLRANKNLSRYILATVFGVWCMDYFLRLLQTVAFGAPILVHEFFSPIFLIMGTFLVITLLPYVIQIVRPGWITWKRCFLLFLPWMGLSAVYFIILHGLDQQMVHLRNMSDLMQHLSSFNVWYRFLLLAMLLVYLFLLHWTTVRYKYYYDKWCEENYSNTWQMDISWLRFIAIGLWGITLAFLFMLCNTGYIPYIVHQMVVQAVFILAFYKGLFQENPYTDRFFKETLDEEKALLSHNLIEPVKPKDEELLEAHLVEYMQCIDLWMKTHKPYLRKELKLMDMSEVLPLNRTYLSHVFNNGFKKSFSQYIQDLRLEEAKGLLAGNPRITVKEVVHNCGFSSNSSFHHLFIDKVGVTPRAYRDGFSK